MHTLTYLETFGKLLIDRQLRAVGVVNINKFFVVVKQLLCTSLCVSLLWHIVVVTVVVVGNWVVTALAAAIEVCRQKQKFL